NYAGHRLAPWLSHIMVSRQATARPLLTPGEVMQLPSSDVLVLVSGLPPIRAKKLRYYEDRNFTSRVAVPPWLSAEGFRDQPPPRANDWSGQVRGLDARLLAASDLQAEAAEGGLQQRRHPGLSTMDVTDLVIPTTENDLDFLDDEASAP